jgi:hypothetical protein
MISVDSTLAHISNKFGEAFDFRKTVEEGK